MPLETGGAGHNQAGYPPDQANTEAAILPNNGGDFEVSKEAAPIRRSYEYRDDKGNLLGTAVVELAAELIDIPGNHDKETGKGVRGRKLLRMILNGEKDGQPSEVDVLKLANPNGVQIVVSENRLLNYSYEESEKLAIVPPLESPLDLGIMLHELGHADQFHDARFAKIAPLYELGGVTLRGSWPGKYIELVDAVLDAVPEVRQLINREQREQFEKLNQEIEKEVQAALIRYSLDVTWHLALKWKLVDIIKAPRRMMERDATRRALEWARKIRDMAGVNLLAKHDSPVAATLRAGVRQRQLKRGEECADSTQLDFEDGSDLAETTSVSMLGELKAALQTYGADKFRHRRPDKPDDIGIMPAAGSERTLE